MTDVGVAYVQLVPSMRNFSAGVSKEMARALTGPAVSAGEDAGKSMSAGVATGVSANEGKVKKSAGKLGTAFKGALAGVGIAAGVALVGGVTSALNQQVVTDKLEAQLGGGQFAEDAGKIAGTLYGEAFGGSLADTSDAVKAVIQSGILSGDDASSGAIEDLTRQALTFTDVLDQDLQMSLQAVDRMLATGIASSSEQAFDILTKGIQAGADSSGDLTETFQEYSTMFRDIGISAGDAMGLLSQGLQGGARDADTVADSLKEFAIRGQDGSKAAAAGFEAVGLSAAEMTAAVAKGGPEARAALGQVLDGLQKMEDPAARNAAAIALFGTKAEDLGDALFNLDLDQASTVLGDTAGATEGLGSAYDNAATKIESFKRRAMQTMVEFIGNRVIPALEKLAEILGPIVSAAAGVVKRAMDAIDWAAIGAAVSSFVGIFRGLGTASIEVDGITSDIFPKIGELISSVMELISTVVAGTVAVVGFIWRQWGDEIIAFTTYMWELIGGLISNNLDIIIGLVQFVTAILKGDWSAAGEALKRITAAMWENIKLIFRAGIAALKLALKAGWTVLKALASAGINAMVSFAKTQIDRLVGFFKAIPGRVKQGFRNLATTITSPFSTAFSGLRRLWNRTVGGFGFSIPSWVPKIGGKSFKIPRMHTGGIFEAPTGRTEGLALLKQGEGVFTPDQMRAIGGAVSTQHQPAAPATTRLEVGPGAEGLFAEWIRNTVRVVGGGDVQQAFGQ